MIGRTNTGGGGGVGVGFSIVESTTRPANPAVNTVWVNTDKKVSGYVLSASEPETPEEGMLWVGLSDSGPVKIASTVGKAWLVFFVSGVQIYNNGAWASVDACIYRDGEWEQFSYVITDLYLYDNGEAKTEFKLSNATLTTSYIQLSMPKSGTASAETVGTYALDKFTKCEVDYTNFECASSTAHPTLYIYIKDESGTTVASANVSKSNGSYGTLSMNLSLTGNHSIEVRGGNASGNYTASVRVTGIRLLM